MTHKINMTDSYTTRNGLPAKVVAINLDLDDGYSVAAIVDGFLRTYTSEGFFLSKKSERDLDLIHDPKMHDVELWVNVDRDGSKWVYDTKEDADVSAFTDRIACIRMTATAKEGQYDE